MVLEQQQREEAEAAAAQIHKQRLGIEEDDDEAVMLSRGYNGNNGQVGGGGVQMEMTNMSGRNSAGGGTRRGAWFRPEHTVSDHVLTLEELAEKQRRDEESRKNRISAHVDR